MTAQLSLRQRVALVAVFAVFTACVTAAPVQTTVASAKTIFYDNFTSVKGEWQQVSGIWETYTAGDGTLAQKSDDPRALNAIRYVQTPRIADATLETSLRVSPTRPVALTDSDQDRELMRNIRFIIGAGLIFRMKDPKNYYMFRLAGEEGAVLGKMVDGVWTDIDNPRVRDFLQGSRIGFRSDNWYRLKVEVYGNRIVCSINDEPIINKTDNTFESGNFGVVTFKTAADFDYVKVTNRNESEVRTQ